MSAHAVVKALLYVAVEYVTKKEKFGLIDLSIKTRWREGVYVEHNETQKEPIMNVRQ